jgi:hypothetical protein
MCKKDSSRGQGAPRNERSVWARRCKPRERQLGLPRSLAGRNKSPRWPGCGILCRQACDKRSRTSFINCEYESIKFNIGQGRRGRMKARGRFLIPFADRLPFKVKSCQRFLSSARGNWIEYLFINRKTRVETSDPRENLLLHQDSSDGSFTKAHFDLLQRGEKVRE